MSSGSRPATRAAASSIASGSPSTRRQISPRRRQARSVSSATARTRTRALSEQLHRGARRDLLEARVRTDHGQRGEPVGHLAVDPQRLSTRRENSKTGQSRRQRGDEIGDGGHDVLAVVDHEQHIAFGQPVG